MDFSTRDRPPRRRIHSEIDRYRATRETTCSTSFEEKKTKNNNEDDDDDDAFWRTRGKKVAFASMVASMLALNTTSFEGMDRFVVANAMERDGAPHAEQQQRQMFDIAFEEETSSSQQQQQQNPAMAKPDEMKPELGQGFFKDLEIFIEREPPIAVGFLFLFLINGVGGVIFTLFIRETNVGPGGEFGKVLAALRKEIIKEIFKFFGGALGRFTKEE